MQKSAAVPPAYLGPIAITSQESGSRPVPSRMDADHGPKSWTGADQLFQYSGQSEALAAIKSTRYGGRDSGMPVAWDEILIYA